MSFEVDRSSWAHIALCADLTWATEPPDGFIIANQRLWAQHRRLQQVLQETASDSQNLHSEQSDLPDKRSGPSQTQDNVNSSGRRNAKDVIPESRLAQFYGNFYYDEHREKCYSNPSERINFCGYSGQGRENIDLTECWMLPEVEYWFRKLLEEPSDRSMLPRRRRQYRMLQDDDLCVHVLSILFGSKASERWGPSVARDDEAALAARISSVRGLWSVPPRAPSPPQTSRKIRARRRQPRRLTALPPPPPAYCLEIPAQLFCDPTCKFQFDPPRPAPQLAECQRAMGRLTATVTAAIRASTARCPYRGTNVSRYAPTGQRPRCQDRRYIWWPRDHPSPRLDNRFQLTQSLPKPQPTTTQLELTENQEKNAPELTETKDNNEKEEPRPSNSPPKENEKENVDEEPSTSSAAIESGLHKKRLYSTVLSCAPTQISLTPVGCVRLAQKLAPGILKLNSKIVLPRAKIRPADDHKFEELEKEALEQYKASDESIDTKFQELEKQAEEQYSNSNSNTSCSSGSTAEKKNNCQPPEDKAAKFPKEKPVDSFVIYSQNFPDLNTKPASSDMNLKNCHAPQRGEKKESHKGKSRVVKEFQRAASDTDYETKEAKRPKGPMRWSLHVSPKKRHLTVCVSDFSSDDETGSIKGAGPKIKNHGKMKMSAHGGGDLNPIMRKTT